MNTEFNTFTPTDFFEGAEKLMEIWYKTTSQTLRDITRKAWEEILISIGAYIVSYSSTEEMDSYVLSESSLFVWKDHFVLKTCGQTTLLSAYCSVNQITSNMGLKLCRFFYSHKAFMKPELQKYPHQNIADEVKYLSQIFPNGRWNHFVDQENLLKNWSIFTHLDPNEHLYCSVNDITTELMMYHLEDNCLRLFSSTSYNNSKSVKTETGINNILAGCTVDDKLFEPYGYSANGFRGSEYFTVHVTPQHSCSYASFETNAKYNELVKSCKSVLNLFKPGLCCVSCICYHYSYASAISLLRALCSKKRQSIKLVEIGNYAIFYAWF